MSRPGIIAGVVTDLQGRAVAGARISFVDGPTALPDVAALTDSRGAFTLSAPLSGDYTIQCVADGYSPQSIHVSILSGHRIEVRCRLDLT